MHDALFAIARALNITRPLTVFDTETTGVNVDEDRIVELAMTTVTPWRDGEFESSTWRSLFHPGRPIPKDASAIHGITDADVTHAPTFGQKAVFLAEVFNQSDLVAYNGRKFDVRLLAKEFERADQPLAAKAVREALLIDPFVIFCKKEARDLTAALKFYCDRELGDAAHGAESDTAACQIIRDALRRKFPGAPVQEVA